MVKDYDYYMVYVDEVQAGSPIGYIVNPCIQKPIEFCDLSDMILKINETMQRLKREVEQSRDGEIVLFHSFRDIAPKKRPQYFFLVQMIGCDKISWHGLLEGSTGCRRGFKSALDLMCRIDCVLRNGKRNRAHKIGRYRQHGC